MSLYSAGITLGPDGCGALVVIEKIPRKTERTQAVVDDGIVIDRDPIYECAARFVGVEQLAGPLQASVAQLTARLRDEPLIDDTYARIEIGPLGRPALAIFRDRGWFPAPVLVAGEKEATDSLGTRVIPMSSLQSTATLMLESGRVQVVDGLIEGPSLLHALERVDALPTSGPARDLGIAAAIALHGAATTGGGEWPSNKPKPQAMLDRAWAREAKRHASKLARKPPW